MALVAASSGGWRTLYLGPNMPVEDIVNAVEDRRASAIALSVVYPADDPELTDQLQKLRQLLPVGIPILVGGRSTHAYASVLDEIGAIRITGLTQLRQELDRLRKQLGATPEVGSHKV
jgi:methylmalonyl-CoA mutase cobalamin-binding subunit